MRRFPGVGVVCVCAAHSGGTPPPPPAARMKEHKNREEHLDGDYL